MQPSPLHTPLHLPAAPYPHAAPYTSLQPLTPLQLCPHLPAAAYLHAILLLVCQGPAVLAGSLAVPRGHGVLGANTASVSALGQLTQLHVCNTTQECETPPKAQTGLKNLLDKNSCPLKSTEPEIFPCTQPKPLFHGKGTLHTS